LQRGMVPAAVRESVKHDPGRERPAPTGGAVEGRREGLLAPPVGDLDLLDGLRSGPQVSSEKANGACHTTKLRGSAPAGPGLRPAPAASHTRGVHTSSHPPPQPGPPASRRSFLRSVAAATAALPAVLSVRPGAAQAPPAGSAAGQEGEPFWRGVRDRF